ncbi:MAG TPA: carboxypeptidase-like regulatory domain-containing protein, partial [Thermoanaerobaculia bacterium]|nr:carboxypeptidase-like regulatory domain-containing protein [Thermoanaerobaculia bacterium]
MTSLRQSTACLIAALLLPALALAAEIPIDGCVAAAPGGRPLPKAQAQLRPVLSLYENSTRALQGQGKPEPVERVATDEDGCFTLHAPEAGMWIVSVEAPGFVPMEQWLAPLFEAASLPLVELEPDVGLRVRIEDAGGKPLAGAQVRIHRTWPVFRSGWFSPPREGVTAADGMLRLPKATLEEIELWATAPGTFPQQSPRVKGSALSFRLHPGVLRTLALTRAEDGKPLSGALLLHHPSRLPLGRTGATGEAVLATPALERFEIITLGEDGRLTGSWRRANSREVRRIDLALPSPVMVQGSVEDATSRRPVPGALVWPETDPASFVRTNAGGKFRLPWTPGSGVGVVAAAPGTFQN